METGENGDIPGGKIERDLPKKKPVGYWEERKKQWNTGSKMCRESGAI